jgi:uncharacterized membrane protein
MLEHIVEFILEILIPICELMGIAIVAVSVLSAFWKYMCSLFTHSSCDVKFRLASGLALSLEFKMAAEILKTVLVREMSELVILGAIIVLRALVTILLKFEIRSGSKKESSEKKEDENVAK